MSNNTRPYTGGCQCGAVRYTFYVEPFDPHICHCRMCQKAFGSFFAPFFAVKGDSLSWMKGAPKTFRSSSNAERGFCAECGTPLTFKADGSRRVNLTIGSLDEPERVKPARQIGSESCLSYFRVLPGLPSETTAEAVPSDYLDKLKSAQHPDHD